MSRLKFKRASAKDLSSRVTVYLSDLIPKGMYESIKKGTGYIITIQDKEGVTYDVAFFCNREGKTLKCTSWPDKSLPVPEVGKPVKLNTKGFVMFQVPGGDIIFT